LSSRDNTQACEINTKKTAQEVVITSRASAVAPHNALVLKTNFIHSTFQNKQNVTIKNVIIFSLTFLAVLMGGYFFFKKRKAN
jgi:ATP-dependent Zn protease